MSFRVLIVNNKTGKTIVDCEETKGIMGSILLDEGRIESLNAVSASPIQMAALMETTQRLLEKLQEDNPRLVLLCQLLGGLTERDEGDDS